MSVSDESGGRPESKRERWARIRNRYESTQITQDALATAEGVPLSTLKKRAMREKWSQRARLVKEAAGRLELEVSDRIRSELRDELAPWIEEQKRKITKRGVKIASRGLDRVEAMFDDDGNLEPKSESYLSKAAETYHRMGRTALGMGEGSAAGGLQLNILTNHSAVQVVATAPA